MDDAALQARLDSIKRRQSLVLALLGGIYLYGLGELVGYWIAGLVGVGCLLGWFGLAIRGRRRTRNVTGQQQTES